MTLSLSSLVETVIRKQNYLLIVTSDRAGHGKIHESDHAEDYRLPLIVCSDTVAVKPFQGIPFSVMQLNKMLEELIQRPSQIRIAQILLILYCIDSS